MYMIGNRGYLKILDILEDNQKNEIARKFANDFSWLAIGLEYREFCNIISLRIDDLKKRDISQLNCIDFFLLLDAGLGVFYLDDPDYFWLGEYYKTVDYLPQLDFANKIDSFMGDYRINVLGEKNKLLKNAISRFFRFEEIGLKDLYPEKYEFIRSKNNKLEFGDEFEVDNKLTFLFGYNFKKSPFFKKYCDGNAFNLEFFEQELEENHGY